MQSAPTVWQHPGAGPRRFPLSNASIDHSGDAKPRRVRVDDPASALHGTTGERVGDDLDHDGKHYVIVLLDGERAEAALDPATLVEITPEGERHRITAYDMQIEVRHAGENTFAEGSIELDGKRYEFRAEADVSSRGTTYTIGYQQYWFDEVPEVDEWFEAIWLDAAADAGYSLDNEVDFTAHAHMTSEERSG